MRVLQGMLGQAKAAVHVVGRSAGALLRDGRWPAVHLQLEETGLWAEQRPDFRRYILLLASREKGTPEHLAFVERLQRDSDEGGLLRPNDSLVIEQPGGMTVQEFIQIVFDGLKP